MILRLIKCCKCGKDNIDLAAFCGKGGEQMRPETASEKAEHFAESYVTEVWHSIAW